jgi:hypothetical protein
MVGAVARLADADPVSISTLPWASVFNNRHRDMAAMIITPYSEPG